MELLDKSTRCQSCEQALALRNKNLITFYDLLITVRKSFSHFQHGHVSLKINSNKMCIISNHQKFLLFFFTANCFSKYASFLFMIKYNLFYVCVYILIHILIFTPFRFLFVRFKIHGWVLITPITMSCTSVSLLSMFCLSEDYFL